jgi:diguanylate cyclase (GGDEF)-like protein
MDVPRWFTSLVNIQGPRGEALISSGWKQLGKVSVRVHPEYAYRQLYDAAIATLAWLMLLFALALIAMRVYLADILKPLKLIEQTAAAISNRQFVPMDIQPRTRELQRVTEAMNSLSAKIRDAIAEESARAERLRREAYEDALTGQLNRRGFDQAVEAALGRQDEVLSGTLALFSLGGLDAINRSLGLSKGNDVLKQLATALASPKRGEGSPSVQAVVGRWQGPTLAAFLPNTAPEAAREWAGALCRSFAGELQSAGLPAGVTVSAGLAGFAARQATLAELGKRAESALAQSCTRGTGEVLAGDESAQPARLDAREEVERAIAAGRVVLLHQKVMSVADPAETLQVELMSQLLDAARNPVAAAVFVPIAAQYGLLPALDRTVVGAALAAMHRVPSLPSVVSLNVSVQSVGDAGFRSALQQQLKAQPALARRLVFEMTGASASRSRDVCRRFAADLKALGSRFALDNFEVDRDSIGLVHDLMPAYIKLAAVFTREIGQREDVRFILEAMLRMVRPLEIPIIAQGVEDAALVGVLRELGISGYQGYAAGRPEPL